MDIERIIALALFALGAIGLFFLHAKERLIKDYSPVRLMARVGVFGAISAILYLVPVFKISLPFFPSFLELHFDEVPAFIAGFAYGPFAGFAVIAIKTLMKINSHTFFVGELTDLLLSSVYVVIASVIYQRKRNLKGVAIGFALATIAQVVVAMLVNVYLMIPFYCNVMGYLPADLLYVMQKAVPAISDIRWSYAFLAVLPFNLLKDGLVIAITFVVYRSLHHFLRFEGKKKSRA